MSSIRFIPCSNSHQSKDIEYGRLFSEPLSKPGGTISYEGYLRALQLYGREDQLINSHKVHRYDMWLARYPELHHSYREQAIRDGYNPCGGTSNAFAGIYYPTPPPGGSSRQSQADSGLIYLHAPSISVKRRPIHLSHHPQGLKLAQKPWCPQDAPHGTQVASLLPPRTQLRTIKEMYRQGARDAIGAAENALLLAELVKSLITPGVTADQHEKARSILTSMGDLKGLTASLNIIVADHATESESPQLGSAIRAAYNSGGSATTGSRFNDTPIPIDLTGSLSARKRRATQLVDLESDEDLAQFEEAADRTRDGIPATPRPLPAMGGTKGLTTGLDMIIGEQFPELAPSSIDSVLRAAHAGRSGSASNTSKKFNDKPIPIDLTGSSSSRKRQAPDHDSDEDLLGALNAPTTTPTSAPPVRRCPHGGDS